MSSAEVLSQLDAILASRRGADAGASYVAGLYAAGASKITGKIAEESAEVVEAAAEADDGHLVYEVADLWFHCLVLLQSRGIGSDAVVAELSRRLGVSGLEEKAARTRNGSSQ
jgi:phosphoribosyl-ATP pyrophosphohydrolase